MAKNYEALKSVLVEMIEGLSFVETDEGLIEHPLAEELREMQADDGFITAKALVDMVLEYPGNDIPGLKAVCGMADV